MHVDVQKDDLHILNPYDQVKPMISPKGKADENHPKLAHLKGVQEVLNPTNHTAYIAFSEDQKREFEVFKNDKFLNKRFIAHLFGDSFMQDTIYEGWFITDALMHMIAILDENEISPDVSRVLDSLKRCLAWQERIISFSMSNEKNDLENLLDEIEEEQEVSEVEDSEETQETQESSEVEEVPEHLTPLEKITAELQEAIRGLDLGGNLLIPGGCRGHSVLYEVVRSSENGYTFGVYNSGDGIEKHNIILEDEGSQKAHAVYRLHDISVEKIASKEFLGRLIDLKTTSIDNFGEKLYEDILNDLGGKKEEVSVNPNDYMLIQRSGTCSWKMFSAYLRYNLPLIERKYIKLKARLDVFQKWYDLNRPLDCVEISQGLLSKLIINYRGELFGHTDAPLNFSREELLTMGIYKVKKTFNKYKFLLSEEEIEKAETWHKAFTGQSIHAA